MEEWQNHLSGPISGTYIKSSILDGWQALVRVGDATNRPQDLGAGQEFRGTSSSLTLHRWGILSAYCIPGPMVIACHPLCHSVLTTTKYGPG